LTELCRIYWRPVFALICRRGHSTADAQDLTQDFFVMLLKGTSDTREPSSIIAQPSAVGKRLAVVVYIGTEFRRRKKTAVPVRSDSRNGFTAKISLHQSSTVFFG